jgi:VanZ family protein
MVLAYRPWICRWVLAGYWAVIYFLTHWPKLDDLKIRPDWLFPGSDKLVHACFYVGWIVLWWWVLTAGGRRLGRAAWVWLAVGAAGYAVFDEVTQAIVGRQPEVLDFSCDLLGAVAAILILSWWQKRREADRAEMVGSRAGRGCGASGQ